MTDTRARFDANDRAFAQTRGMLWGAGAGLTVPLVVTLLIVGLGDGNGLGFLAVFIGIFAVVVGAVTGAVFATWSVRGLARGMTARAITAISALTAAVVALVVISLVILGMTNGSGNLQSFVTLVFVVWLFCIPAVLVATYGVRHTLRALVLRSFSRSGEESPTS